MLEVNNVSDSNSSNSVLPGRKLKKNNYRKLEAGAYPRMYLQQLEDAAKAIAKNDFSDTRMVSMDIRTGRYRVTTGFGKRNTWFPNGFLKQGEFAECKDADEAFGAIMRLIQAAKDGKFNDALEALRIQRQEHAARMIEERDVCGFHRKHKPALDDASSVVKE